MIVIDSNLMMTLIILMMIKMSDDGEYDWANNN